MTASPTGWTKASASTGNGQCLELRALPSGRIAVRDSKNPDAAALVFTREEITAWLAGAKAGEFDEFGVGGQACREVGGDDA